MPTVRSLTGSPGVGVGELAADDDLIRLRPVEVAAVLVELAEEVANVVLGALVQDLEVGGELHGGVPTEKSRWSKADLSCNIGGKKKRCFTPDGDGVVEERQRNPRRCACCCPSVLKEERRLGFLEFEEEEGKESSSR